MVLRAPMLLNGEFRVSPNIGKGNTHKMVWDQWSGKPQRAFPQSRSQTLKSVFKGRQWAGEGCGLRSRAWEYGSELASVHEDTDQPRQGTPCLPQPGKASCVWQEGEELHWNIVQEQ